MDIENLSSPKPGHTTGGSGTVDAGQGKAGQNKVPTLPSAQKATVPPALQRTVTNYYEHLFASTNKGNPI